MPNAFRSVTPGMLADHCWHNHCQHVPKEEDRFWKDGLQEDCVEQWIIELEIEDDEEDDDIDVVEGHGHSDSDDDDDAPEMDKNDRELFRTDEFVEVW